MSEPAGSETDLAGFRHHSAHQTTSRVAFKLGPQSPQEVWQGDGEKAEGGFLALPVST